MKTKRLDSDGRRIFALILEEGDEVMGSLTAFANEAGLAGSQFTAIGAFRRAVLGYFDPEKKDYIRIDVPEQVEVLTLAGDVALDRGKRRIHAHVVVSKRDGTAHGGHLLEATVWPTLELILTEMPESLQRQPDPETGLALISV